MASATKIEWTDYNWNFLRGCSRVSEGCRHCYAETIAARFSGEGLPYHGLATMVNGEARWTGEISFYEDILLKPLTWRKPRRVFVNSMSDLFHEKVKDEWLDKAFVVMALTPQHTYQILTKRPERMRHYLSMLNLHNVLELAADRLLPGKGHPSFGGQHILPGLPLSNVWLGISCEDQKTADERIPLLLQTQAAVRWLSCEPLLGPVDLRAPIEHYLGLLETNSLMPVYNPWDITHTLDWVVVGGESGHGARPCDVEWIRSIIGQCKAASVPVFVKQLGAKPEDSTHRDIWGTTGKHHYTRPVGDPLLEQAAAQPGYTITHKQLNRHMQNRKGGDPSEWPEDLQVREYPK